MVKGSPRADKADRFAAPPWAIESQAWQAIDERLPVDHVARRIANAVSTLDLAPLWDSYSGVGKKALPPDLLLAAVIYELHNKRPSPAQWTKDASELEPLRWLLFGLEPSRTHWYDFRDRLMPFWDRWNAQVLHQAIQAELTTATRTALDSTYVAANASRRKLLNDQRLHQRQQVIDTYLQTPSDGQATTPRPGWLAKSEVGLREQKHRYAHASEVMGQRQEANAARRTDKRKPTDQVLVSPSDPDAALGRDKEGVFRPLYTVQFIRDLDSPLICAFEVRTQVNDNGVLGPLVERMVQAVGIKPQQLLVDCGYVSIQHLEFCQREQITLYGPCQENDFSAANGKKPQSNQHTEIPKSKFRWLPDEQTYQCPEGHHLKFTGTRTQRRADHTISLDMYTCPPQHCQACPCQRACTRTPKKGRTVSRMANEELLDELRVRVGTEEAKALYKQRSRTVELSFADLKEHRGLRRFHCRGLRRVQAEIGSLVLTHNLLAVEKRSRHQQNELRQATLPKSQTLRR